MSQPFELLPGDSNVALYWAESTGQQDQRMQALGAPVTHTQCTGSETKAKLGVRRSEQTSHASNYY